MPHEGVRIRRDRGDYHDSALHRQLLADVDGEVRFDAGTRALYATDASNYRQEPIGVVVPRTTEAAVAALSICHHHQVPVLPRGGGTSLAGQCCNHAVVIDCSRHLTAVEIDGEAGLARVQPGLILDRLKEAAAPHRLDFGPDPATHDRCTLGGMIGNDSCGVHSLMAELYGPGPRTSHHVLSLDVVTYDGVRLQVGRMSPQELRLAQRRPDRAGQILRELEALRDRHGQLIRDGFPQLPRRASGYELPALLEENGFDVARALVGTEATCVFVLGATLRLSPRLPHRALVVLGFPDVESAADAVPAVRERRPVACEGIDDVLAENIRKLGRHAEELALLPEGNAWLLIEHAATEAGAARAQAEETVRRLAGGNGNGRARILDDRRRQHELWEIRESGLAVTAFVPGEPDAWPGWEDAAVPPERLGVYLRDFKRLCAQHQLSGALYGHFGQGCVHTRIDFDLRSDPGVEQYRRFTEDAARLVHAHGGSLSGEHGDGQARADLLEVMYGAEVVELFREFKAIWDPDGAMNPGKVVSPRSRTEDLRLRTPAHDPGRIRLDLGRDHHDFDHATVRCVGVGKCRKTDGGTMCPSYMVTRDERHTTRGRAHMLFEMMHGDILDGKGWRSDEVMESLDLCLACKACKRECPVNVDMAAYKAEFLSHHYRWRLRPRHAYAFGWIHGWLGLSALAPRLAGRVLAWPPVAALVKTLGGIARERELPALAPATFRQGFAARWRGKNPDGRPVLLWPDTFNDAFFPEILDAAAAVLVDAGYRVEIPRRRLCCGRPTVENGWLKRARRMLRRSVSELAEVVDAGVPIVGVEPSCTVALRDELRALLPADEQAMRTAAATRSLAELLGEDSDYQPPRLRGRAIYHAHCQQQAVLGSEADLRLLRRAGLEVEALDSGCCGMAGAFGFRSDTYVYSKALAERRLLPAVREREPETLVIADGFSCREQLRQLGGVRPLHLAEALLTSPPAR